mgnify:CR=1 FL=1
MGRLSAQARYAGVAHFRVDYDTQKDLMKQFGARDRSTLIMFKGQKEVGRVSFVTDEKEIRALIDKGL